MICLVYCKNNFSFELCQHNTRAAPEIYIKELTFSPLPVSELKLFSFFLLPHPFPVFHPSHTPTFSGFSFMAAFDLLPAPSFPFFISFLALSLTPLCSDPRGGRRDYLFIFYVNVVNDFMGN